MEIILLNLIFRFNKHRYGYIDHRVGNRTIILTSFLPFYSGFLPYHKELVEGSETCNKIDVSV